MLISDQMHPVTFFELLLVLPLVSSTSLSDLCPSQESIHPCFCVSDGKNIRIDCIRVTSLTDLRGALRGLKGHREVTLDLMRCRFPEVPSDLFSGLHLTRLSFTESEISEKSQLVFSGMDHTLQDLSVTFSFPENNGLTLLKTSNLQSLEHLEIEGNYIKKLGNDWFENGPKTLKNLFIMTNDIEELGSDAFTPLAGLKNLWVTGNTFSTISRSMFPRPAYHLLSIDLGENKISDIPFNLFTDMPSLKDVTFSGNQIKTLSEVTWSEVWKQLTRVYINDNPLNCDDSINWMLKAYRPHVLRGKCVSPPSMKDRELRDIVDSAKEETEYVF